MHSQKIPIVTKAKIYMYHLQPVALYGMEYVTWTKNLVQKVRVFHNDIMRTITIVNCIIRSIIKKTAVLKGIMADAVTCKVFDSGT